MTGEAELSPRILRAGEKHKKTKNSPFLTTFIRLEIILGAIIVFTGGFSLRVQKTYDIIVIGSCLLVLGLFRMIYTIPPSSKKSSLPEDRLLFRLRTSLSPEYFIGVNYPLPGDNTIDELVVGPNGIFVINKLWLRGEVEGEREAQTWQHQPSEAEHAHSIDNPFFRGQKKCQELKELLSTVNFSIDSRPVENCLVLMYHNIDGSALDHDRIFRLGEMVDFLDNYSPPDDLGLNWEQVNEIETALKKKVLV